MTTLKPVPEKGHFVKFDPTFNTGHIVQTLVFVVAGFVAWSDVKTGQATQKLEIDHAKSAQVQQAEAIKAIATDVRELGRSMSDVRTDIAVLRGRAAEPGSKK